MYKSILLPIDLVHPSSWKNALPVTLEIAKAFKASLHLVNVVPAMEMSEISMHLPEDFEEKSIVRAGEQLGEFAAEHIPAGIEHQNHVAHGVVRREIVKAADTLGCDLIVMAPHRPEMTDFFISPCTEFVVSHTNSSVLVVRE